MISTRWVDEKFKNRFWSKVTKTDTCWIWNGAKKNGYGAFWINERVRAGIAHRLSYEMMIGEITQGMTLDHLCSNRSCVNPSHLEQCTFSENTKRKFQRLEKEDYCGERSKASFLTEDDVMKIRSHPGKHGEIAKMFGTCRTNICSIKNRRTWNHVP